MKTILRATLLVSLILSVAWPVLSQEKQSLNTDNLREQIKNLEAINVEGKSTSIQEIHKRALVRAYKQFQWALQQEIEDLKNMQKAIADSNTETQQEIASELKKLAQENTDASLKIQDLTGSQPAVTSSEASSRGPAALISTTAESAGKSPGEARMAQSPVSVASETARTRTANAANSLPTAKPPIATPTDTDPCPQTNTGATGQTSTSLNADLNCRVKEAARAKIQQRETTKQAEPPNMSNNSTSLVDTSSAGDLVNVGLSLAGLTGGTNDPSKNANSVSVTTSAYALYAASRGADPLNPGFYNRNSGWRKLSLTLGYDDETSKTGVTQRAKIFGVKYLIIDKRDPARKRHLADYNTVGENLKKAAIAFGNLDEKISYYFATNRTVKEKILVPQFRVFLNERLKNLGQGANVASDAARITGLTSRIESGQIFILNNNGLPPNTGESGEWTREEKEFYSDNFRAPYLSLGYRAKLKEAVGQQVLDDLDAFVNKQLTDTKAYEDLSDSTREALERIRRAPQFSFYFLTKQRSVGEDEYTGETIFDYGVANRINLTLNGNYFYRNSKIIGGDTRGGKFSGQFRFQMTPEKLAGRNPLFLSVSGDAEAVSGRKPTFHAQAKLTIPILNGLDLPFSVTYANRTGLIKENKIKGQFGFSIDTSRLLQALTLK